jgi:DNA-binding beta-propeller fold protein YncE
VAIADNGDQSVLMASGPGAGILNVVAGTGGNGPYLQDGLSATGATAELNDPQGIAISPLGTLYITDGIMRAIRVVPALSGIVAGRAMTAGNMYTLVGALPIASPSGASNGTQWVVTHVTRPIGIVLSPFGGVFFSDAGTGQVREIG